MPVQNYMWIHWILAEIFHSWPLAWPKTLFLSQQQFLQRLKNTAGFTEWHIYITEKRNNWKKNLSVCLGKKRSTSKKNKNIILYVFLHYSENGSYCPSRCGDVHSSRSTVEDCPGWSCEPGRCSSVCASDPEATWVLQVQTPPGHSREGINKHISACTSTQTHQTGG